MHASLKWLVLASFINLAGNGLGTVVAFQQNLPADLGSIRNSQSVLEDFLGFKGTALSAPLSFLLIQLVITLLATRPGRSGEIGVRVLTFIGLFYTLAQAGEPIVLGQFRPGGFDIVQFILLVVNIATALAMLVFGIKVRRSMRAPQTVQG